MKNVSIKNPLFINTSFISIHFDVFLIMLYCEYVSDASRFYTIRTNGSLLLLVLIIIIFRKSGFSYERTLIWEVN